MPWASIEDVPKHLQHYGLGRANKWAEIFDAVKRDGKDEDSAAAIATTQMKKMSKGQRVLIRMNLAEQVSMFGQVKQHVRRGAKRLAVVKRHLRRQRGRKPEQQLFGKQKGLTILRMGLGRDSITMMLLLAEQGLIVGGERIGVDDVDALVFTDTGNEWPHTYELIPRVQHFADQHGMRFIIQRKPPEELRKEFLDIRTRGEDVKGKQPWLKDAASMTIDEKAQSGAYHMRPTILEDYASKRTIVARTDPSCTANQKIAPNRALMHDLSMEKFGLGNTSYSAAVKRGDRDPHRVLIGFAADEQYRIDRARKGEETGRRVKYEANFYPLAEMGITKQGEQEILERHGFGDVMKSGCWMCKFQPKDWYVALAETSPESFKKVIEYERAAMTRNPKLTIFKGQPIEKVVQEWRASNPDVTVEEILRKDYKRGGCGGGETLSKAHPVIVIGMMMKGEQLALFGGPTKVAVRAHIRQTPTKATLVKRHERKPRPRQKIVVRKPFDGARHAKKLRKLADGMQRAIDEASAPSYGPETTMTRRRSAQAASKFQRAEHLKTTQAALRVLASQAEAGTLAPELLNVKNRTTIESLLYERQHPATVRLRWFAEDIIDRKRGGDSEVAERVRAWVQANAERRMQRQDEVASGWEPREVWTEKQAIVPMSLLNDLTALMKEHGDDFNWRIAELPKRMRRARALGADTEEAWQAAREAFRAVWKQAESGTAEDPKAKELREKMAEARLLKIPGYFPTPKPLVDKVLEEADIEAGHRVLEPSAGMGDIANAVKVAEPGAEVHAGETSSTLREVLELQGHELVSRDFLAYNPGQIYDRIVQNPPFEKGQDVDHVLHAFDLLKPGGRLVSIMSEGPFFRESKKDIAFRTWLREVGWSQKNPPGSFKSATRPTGVATRIVIIDKPEA